MSDTTNISSEWHRSYPVGPYSQVSTGTGTLQTAIPFFSLKGAGRTSMSFGIYHRSNPTYNHYANTRGYAGLGWQPSTFNYVKAGGGSGGATVYNSDATQVSSGNAVSHWVVPSFNGSGVPSGYNRRPGCRADLHRMTSNGLDGTGTLQGFLAVDQATAVKYYYQNHDVTLTDVWELSRVEDPRGNYVNYAYDSLSRCYQMTDSAGRYAALTWAAGSAGQLQSVVLHAGSEVRTWFLVYDTYSLRKVVMPPAQTGDPQATVRFVYGLNNDSVTDLYDPRGAHWHYDYGTLSGYGLVAADVYEPVPTPPASYDPENPTSAYDSSSATAFNYFINNNSTATTGSVGSTSFSLQPHTWTMAISDRLGKLWRHEYDYGVTPPTGPGTSIIPNEWMGNPIRRVYDPTYTGPTGLATNAYESFTWDYTQGTLTQYVDREGRETDIAYDGNNWGLPNRERRYLTGTTYYDWAYGNYCPAGAQPRRVQSVDPDGRRTVEGYDWSHDEHLYTDVDAKTDPYYSGYSKPAGVHIQTNWTYNAQGEVASTYTGSDPATTYSNFNALGEPQTVTTPAGDGTTFTYDVWGNKKSQTEPSPGGTTGYDYDNFDRLILTTLPGGATVGADYDLSGNPTLSVKEDGTNVTTAYDAFNRPTSVSQPTGTTTLVTGFGYDVRGLRTSVTNPRNLTTNYDFDERGKLYRIRYPDVTNRQFAYDGVGNRVWVQNGRGQRTNFVYDGYNRLKTIDYPNSADVGYTYRIDGARLTMTDGTGATTYTYDDAGRLKTQAQGLTGKTLTTVYVAGTNRRSTLSDGTQTWTTGYDAGLRPKTLAQTVGSASPVTNTTYDATGAVSVQTFGNATQTAYGYDARGRVTSIAHATTGGVAQQTLNYGYGPDGNLLTYADNAAGVGTWSTTYAHDKADRLTSEVRTGGPSGNLNVQYAYDGQGNRLSTTRNGATSTYGSYGANDQFASGDGFAFSSYDNDGNPGAVSGPSTSMSLVYDEMGRVTSISGTGASTFRYDGDGKRVERVAAGVTTRFVLDGDTVVEETNGSNVVTLYRTPGVGFVRNGAQRYEQDSALGSLLAARDASGSVTGRTEYDAYGAEVYATGTDRGSYRFAGAKGYANDDATGMQLLGARYYLPALGRFLTQDPIGHEGGLNLYAYCADNPLSRVDPKGLDPFTIFGMEFSGATVGNGLGTGLAAVGHSFSFGHWTSPYYAGQPGYGTSVGLADFSRDTLITAATSAGAGAAWTRLGGKTINIMAGRNLMGGSHVMYEVGGQVLHGAGTREGGMVVERYGAGVLERFLQMGKWKPILSVRLPILNAEAASATGQSARDCVDAAFQALLKGYRF